VLPFLFAELVIHPVVGVTEGDDLGVIRPQATQLHPAAQPVVAHVSSARVV